jgi:hypothetical protein
VSFNRGIVDFLKDLLSDFRVIFEEDFANKKSFRQNSYIFINFHSLLKVLSSGKKVCYCI